MRRKPRGDWTPEEGWQIVQEQMQRGNIFKTCRDLPHCHRVEDGSPRVRGTRVSECPESRSCFSLTAFSAIDRKCPPTVASCSCLAYYRIATCCIGTVATLIAALREQNSSPATGRSSW